MHRAKDFATVTGDSSTKKLFPLSFQAGIALIWFLHIILLQVVLVWRGIYLMGVLCYLRIGQIEASTCPPSPGIPRAFDTFAVPGRREFDYQSLPGGGEFDPHALGVGDLNCTLDFM